MSSYTERRQLLALAATAVGATMVASCAQRPPESDEPGLAPTDRAATDRPADALTESSAAAIGRRPRPLRRPSCSR